MGEIAGYPPFFLTARGREKLEEYFPEMQNRGIELLAVQGDPDSDFAARKGRYTTKGRRRTKLSTSEVQPESIAIAKEIFHNFYRRRYIFLPGNSPNGQGEIVSELEEIEICTIGKNIASN